MWKQYSNSFNTRNTVSITNVTPLAIFNKPKEDYGDYLVKVIRNVAQNEMWAKLKMKKRTQLNHLITNGIQRHWYLLTAFTIVISSLDCLNLFCCKIINGYRAPFFVVFYCSRWPGPHNVAPTNEVKTALESLASTNIFRYICPHLPSHRSGSGAGEAGVGLPLVCSPT